MKQLYIGLISGTSLDGVDAVLVDFSAAKPRLVASLCHPYPDSLRRQLKSLCDEKIEQGEFNLAGRLDRQTAVVFAQAVSMLLEQSRYEAGQIVAIGSHGQTVRHYPDGKDGFTSQIGDPNTIAALTGIDVVADFRRMDIALGGQGAPMVPAFHQAVFADSQIDRVIVNLGGIANLTWLPKDSESPILGYDTGPANTLCDQWVQRCKDEPFDAKGQWAKSGACIEPLLARLLEDDYFALPAPKSTGREKFNLRWLEPFIAEQSFSPADIQATLVELSAVTLAQQILACADKGEVYLCGGGSYNDYLVERIGHHLPSFKLSSTGALGVLPEWVEAMAFAWLAKAWQSGQPGNIPSVTGASRRCVLGCLYRSMYDF